jgi:hypothetical protein
MRARTFGAVVAGLGLLTTAAHNTPPNEIEAAATRSGDVVAFEGYANLPGTGLWELPDFGLTRFSDPDVARAGGIDLVAGTIEEYGDGAGLRFTWEMSELPPTGVLPEGVRYNWNFQVGGQTYQLQAKASNLASVTTAEAPVDHVLQAGSGEFWFQLRGACQANYQGTPAPVAGCYHLGFFDGEVDLEAGTITFDLPYGAKDAIGRTVAETFQRGRTISHVDSAGTSVSATFQAGVSNTLTSQYWTAGTLGGYHAGTVVSAGLGTAATQPTAYTALDTPGDGSFAGSLTGTGDTLWVKACKGGDSFGGSDPCIVRAFPVG